MPKNSKLTRPQPYFIYSLNILWHKKYVFVLKQTEFSFSWNKFLMSKGEERGLLQYSLRVLFFIFGLDDWHGRIISCLHFFLLIFWILDFFSYTFFFDWFALFYGSNWPLLVLQFLVWRILQFGGLARSKVGNYSSFIGKTSWHTILVRDRPIPRPKNRFHPGWTVRLLSRRSTWQCLIVRK